MIPTVDWNRIYKAVRVLEAIIKNNVHSVNQMQSRVGGGEETNRMITTMLLREGIIAEVKLSGDKRYLTATPRAKELYETYKQLLEDYSFAIQ